MEEAMPDFLQKLHQDIDKWKAELQAAEAASFPQLGAAIKEWINAGDKLVNEAIGRRA